MSKGHGTKPQGSPFRSPVVAALYVTKGGAYYGLADVDPWDVDRDARLYDGPHPVVAHPPCNRWSLMALCRGLRDGQDEGRFAHALDVVRRFGGVLEHPAHSLAWERFGLPAPARDGWAGSLLDPGYSTEIDQQAYGTRFHKPTWLYAVACDLPSLRWRDLGTGETSVRWLGNGKSSGTPPELRDVLIGMARSVVTKSEVTA
jgi:hypothetical protein